jgi:hypothetical protein
MSDLQGPVTMPEPGQVVEAPDTGTTATAPADTGGQASASPVSDPGQSPATATAPVEETFFDPSTVPPELQPAYKSMQSAFTKKMQAISGERQKLEAYNQIMANPYEAVQAWAKENGFSLTKAQAQQMVDQQQEDWAPNTWQDVINRTKQETRREILAELAPVLQTVQSVQASNIESQLTQLDPEWRRYEDEMRANIAAHPSLVKDVAKLYRLSVPEEVYMSRATQAALKKLQTKANSAQVAEKSQTSRSAPVSQKARTFDEAVAIAKQQMAEQGR